MRHAFAAPLAAASLLLVSGQPTSSRGWTAPEPGLDDPPIHVVADLSARRLSIYQGNTEVESYPVAIGTGSKPTPRGNYTIRKIVWNPAWIPPDADWAKDKKPQPPGAKENPMKLVKIFFKEPDYYIHGTSAVETLGEEASHGCLRMDPDDAYRVALPDGARRRAARRELVLARTALSQRDAHGVSEQPDRDGSDGLGSLVEGPRIAIQPGRWSGGAAAQ
jgi:L,D-transpeptidase-like protein